MSQVLSFLLLLLKIPFLLLMLLLYAVFHAGKYIWVLPALIRIAERITDMVIVKVIM